MARITIDDCTDKIESRFDLVLLSAHRARQLLEGVTLSPEASDEERSEKKTVHALREIAQVEVKPEDLRESLIKRLQSEHAFDSEQNTSLNELISKNTQDHELFHEDNIIEEKINIPQDTLNPSKETLASPLINFSDESIEDPEET